MENNIIKDRIQDVRERFLSGNQIEEIRQNVRTLVDERLDEFQNAQNNAFKELETAIDKLESHQREMIAYFNKQLNNKSLRKWLWQPLDDFLNIEMIS